MQSSKLSDWLTLVANFGVVVGLFLLITELNHSSRLAEVEAYQTRTRDIQELSLQLALSDSLPGVFVKLDSSGAKALTPEEFIRAQAWYKSILRGMQGQYYQYQQGFLERESIDRTLDDIAAGIYDRWKDFELLDDIENQEWLEEINGRMNNSSET